MQNFHLSASRNTARFFEEQPEPYTSLSNKNNITITAERDKHNKKIDELLSEVYNFAILKTDLTTLLQYKNNIININIINVLHIKKLTA